LKTWAEALVQCLFPVFAEQYPRYFKDIMI
jgi:hypothetical protein